jgi:hypothetical protein
MAYPDDRPRNVLAGVALAWAMVMAMGCAQPRGDSRPTSTAQASSAALEEAPTKGAAPMDDAASIGTATMKSDGTIVLQLRATDGTGRIGDAQLEYPPGHPQYQEVLRHVGGLKPGDEKIVPPWPE